MIYRIIVLLAFFLVTTIAVASNKYQDETCISCHERETPSMVGIWGGSAHGKNDIQCIGCHKGEYDIDHEQGGKRTVVEVYICAECHTGAAKEHFSGKHGIGFRAGQACTRGLKKTPEISAGCNNCHELGTALPRQEAECSRFLAQSPEMQRQGCLSCHKVEIRCDACHTAHDTDLSIVRDPAVCATCHMGPDHPQYEMWMTSRHGIMYAQKGRQYSPDCKTCHMPEGSHNVSTGVTMGLAGQKYPENVREAQRDKMLNICKRCHTRSFALNNLADGDAIQRQSKALVDEAASIIMELEKENLLNPSPNNRPAHPLSGHNMDLGPQMLYENLSGIETTFFRMKKFYYVMAYKGVFHQNPDYAHWYGNAPLKLALSEIKSEAAMLRELRRLKERVDNLSEIQFNDMKLESMTPGDALKAELKRLREQYLPGALSEKEYLNRKNKILSKHGL
jgi:hypothetical protein